MVWSNTSLLVLGVSAMLYSMLGFIKGTVFRPNIIVTDSGVGYTIVCADVQELGTEVSLFVSTQYDREGIPTFYGFSSEEGQTAFLSMISVKGIGPGRAIAVLRTCGTQGLLDAVNNKDYATIAKTKGITKATAEQLAAAIASTLSEATAGADEIHAALVDLGYEPGDVTAAVNKARSEVTSGEASDILSAALTHLV